MYSHFSECLDTFISLSEGTVQLESRGREFVFVVCDHILGTAIIPHNSTAEWFPSLTTPCNSGLSLIGDTL